MTNTSPTEGGGNAPATPEKIWATLQRTSDLMAESRADIAKGRAEMAESREYQKETARQMKETDRRLKKAEGLFTSQWGKLMESLVEGDLVPLLKQRGIEVERTLQRMTGRRNGEHFEIDIVAANGGSTARWPTSRATLR